MLSAIDLDFRDIVIVALIIWLFYRHPLTMLAVSLIASGLLAEHLMPLDLFLSLPPLAVIGWGCGILLHQYQQFWQNLRAEARSSRTYTQPHHSLHY